MFCGAGGTGGGVGGARRGGGRKRGSQDADLRTTMARSIPGGLACTRAERIVSNDEPLALARRAEST